MNREIASDVLAANMMIIIFLRNTRELIIQHTCFAIHTPEQYE